MQNYLIWQIGRNVEVYVDDIVIKSTKGEDLLADLAETFQILRAYNIKLNPEKCVLECPLESYSVLWSLGEGLRPTQKKLLPSII